RARVWERGRVTVTLAHPPKVFAAMFSPDGRRILTAGADAMARIWTADGALVATLAGHTQAVLAARFDATGERILTASADKTVRVWSQGGELLSTLTGHTHDVRAVAVSAAGDLVVSAGFDGQVAVHALADGKLLELRKVHIGGTEVVDFLPDGSL